MTYAVSVKLKSYLYSNYCLALEKTITPNGAGLREILIYQNPSGVGTGANPQIFLPIDWISAKDQHGWSGQGLVSAWETSSCPESVVDPSVSELCCPEARGLNPNKNKNNRSLVVVKHHSRPTGAPLR